VAAAATGDEPDLPADGAPGAGDEERVGAGGEDVGVRGHEAGDRLGDDVTGVVDELLHCGLPRRRGAARTAAPRQWPPPGGLTQAGEDLRLTTPYSAGATRAAGSAHERRAAGV